MARRNSRNRHMSAYQPRPNNKEHIYDGPSKPDKSFLDNINNIEDIEQIFGDKKLKAEIYSKMKRQGFEEQLPLSTKSGTYQHS